MYNSGHEKRNATSSNSGTPIDGRGDSDELRINSGLGF